MTDSLLSDYGHLVRGNFYQSCLQALHFAPRCRVYQLLSGRWPRHCSARRSLSMQTSTEAQLISTIVPPAVNMTLPRGFWGHLEGRTWFCVFFCSFQNRVKYAKCFPILTSASLKITRWWAMPVCKAVTLCLFSALLRVDRSCAPTKSWRLSPTSQLPLPLPLPTPASVVSSS